MSEPADVLILGTATPGGGFPLYGAAFAAAIAASDPGLKIETRHSEGSTQNVRLLAAGEIELGLVSGEVAYESLRDETLADLRIVAAMYPTAGLFVTRGDAPYRSIADLRGRRVAFGARGSGLVILARYVLDGLGLDQAKDFEPVYLERAGDGPTMVMQDEVAALWGGGIGWPGFTKVAEGPAKAHFIAPTAEEAGRILARHAFLKRLSVEAGSYPGQDAPIDSVGSWSLIMAHRSLADARAYRLISALHRAESDLGNRLTQARETRAGNVAAAAPSLDLIHAGVLTYLKEQNLLA
jgi:TRAP transporter TAXI family solute receptor